MKRGRKPSGKQPGDDHYRASRHAGQPSTDLFSGLPEPPEELELDANAMAMWERSLAELPREVLASVDGPSLAAMCRWWSQYNQLADLYAKDPENAVLGRQCKQTHDAYCHHADRFGLNPHSRQKVRVRTIAGPTLLEEQQITRCDVMKIDCIGAELIALGQLRGMIEEQSPYMLIDYRVKSWRSFGNKLEDGLEILRSLGYRVYVADDGLTVPLGDAVPEVCNLFCVPEGRRAEAAARSDA